MDGLILALGFLTVIPMPFPQTRPGGMGRAAVWFPLVGLVVGAVVAGTAFGANALWQDRWIAASLALLVNLALTGGLHLDGFMDTADAFFSHRDRERMLEIMKDSRAGALGVASGVLLLLAKFAALSSLLAAGSRFALFALAAAPALGRTGLVLAATCFPRARRDGLGSSFAAEVGRRHLFGAALLAVLLAVVLFGAWFWVFLTVALWATLFVALYWQRRLGGLTGDIYGAINESVELAVLLTAACLVRYI